MPIHTNIVYQLITDSPKLKSIFTADEIRVSCLGAGPGSDVLGILKFLQQEKKVVSLNCGLYDRDMGWSESWNCICSKMSDELQALSKDSFYRSLDVADSGALVANTELMSTDLFTLSFFMSEVYSMKSKVDIFFEKLFKHVKQGSLFLFIDNNAPEFYSWIDALISSNRLATAEESNWGLFTGEVANWGRLEQYNDRFDHSPKLQAHITYRICRKE